MKFVPASSTRRCAAAAGMDPDQPQQLLLFRVRGDGNCLFRALAQGCHMQQKGSLHCTDTWEGKKALQPWARWGGGGGGAGRDAKRDR